MNEELSTTAILIARMTVTLSHDSKYSSLISKEMLEICKILVSAYNPNDICLKKEFYPFYKTLAGIAGFFTLPGFARHYLLRKKYIENNLRQVLQGEIRQVVVLAAGFDTLALRLHKEYKEISFYEIDRKPTQEFKVRSLAESNYKLEENCKFIPADFSQENLLQVLSKSDFNPSLPSVFIAEGIIMYLEQNDAEAIFSSIKNLPAQNIFIFTYLSKLETTNFHAKLCDFFSRLWVASKGEPYKFTATYADIRLLLEKTGFDYISHINYAELHKPHLSEKSYRFYKELSAENIIIAKISNSKKS